MTGQGAGPSRKSHTKSRKGCKTCKRRHIRCDENFPQCRNCTKHQVRCDYMDNAPSDSDRQSSPEQHPMTTNPAPEPTVQSWQRAGSLSYPSLEVHPAPQHLSKSELQLLNHLSSTADSLFAINGQSDLTIWTATIPKFMNLATTYPYVMHALLSFSAGHLSWVKESPDTRNLAIHHGSIALRGLHEAIGTFSRANADGVLAASMILISQATDWRSWSSLGAGIRSVRSAMDSWQRESLFADWIHESSVAYVAKKENPHLLPTSQERYSILQAIHAHLQRLRPFMVGQELELMWLDHLMNYAQRLQASEPARTAEEQFNHLYILRKWMLWVPVQLLQRQGGEGPAMLVLGYLYASALALEPLFPDVGAVFCASLAVKPLEEIIRRTGLMQTQQEYGQSSMEIASLMQFPQQAVAQYLERNPWTRCAMVETDASLQQEASAYYGSLNFDMDAMYAGNVGNISPAFAPTQLDMNPNRLSIGSGSSYLEVPAYESRGFGYGTSDFGAAPSPGFPPQDSSATADQSYGWGFGGFRGGFVPPTIWT